MKKLFVFFSAFFWFSPAFANSFDQIPKLNLLVHKTIASKEMSGWLFEVQNFDNYAVRVSDLEIRFWVYQPEGQLFGLRFKDGQWKNLSGVVNGEAVMCAFLSPSYEIVASRKANYAIRYRSAEETLIPPGKSWKNIRIGFAAPDTGLWNQGDYSQKPASQGRLGEPGWFNGMYDDSHFCLYFRGVLVKEWVGVNKPDPNTGVEPDPYKTHREKLALPQMPAQPQQPTLNPVYARMPALSEPMRIGDDARYVVVNGSMINVGKAKQEIQNYLMQHPTERTTWNHPQNPRIIPASLPLPSSPLSGYSYDNAGNTLTDPVGRTYEYDAENHLIHVSGAGIDITYQYDGDGLRVKKINNLSGVETYYVWDTQVIPGIPMVFEEIENNQPSKRYTYSRNGLISMAYKDGADWVVRYFTRTANGM